MTVQSKETSTVLLSEVYQDSYDPVSKDASALVYQLSEQIRSLAWNHELLAAGTDDAKVLILSPLNLTGVYTLPTPFQRQFIFQKNQLNLSDIYKHSIDLLKFDSKYLVAGSYGTAQLVLVNHTTTSLKQGLSSNKSEPKDINVKDLDFKVLGADSPELANSINSIDLSDEGLVAVTGDSRRVTIYNDPINEYQETSFQLNNIGVKVKFATLRNEDYLLVLEATNILRVLDYKNKKWVLSIYPVSHDSNNAKVEILDFFTISRNDILVVGSNGWFKKYSLENLQGGAGYTQPSQSGTLSGFINPTSSKHPVTVVSNDTLAKLSTFVKHNAASYDLGAVSRSSTAVDGLSNSENTSVAEVIIEQKTLKLNLPSHEILAGSVNEDGVSAIASGGKLLLISA